MEGETIFGSAKLKLDLPHGDDSDSHRHNRVNYSIPNLGKGVSPSQVRAVRRCSHSQAHAQSSVMSSNPSVASEKSDFSMPQGSESANLVIASRGLPIQESPCSDLTQWCIQRVPLGSSAACRGHIDGKRCNAKIAKYRRAVTALIFLGIERHLNSKETRQVQVWFCSTKLDRCVLGLGARWIINYPNIPDKWPMMVGTSLTQAEVISLESVGFVLDDGPALQVLLGSLANDVHNGKDSIYINDTSNDIPTTAGLGFKFRFRFRI